jgi:GxxExxY protein
MHADYIGFMSENNGRVHWDLSEQIIGSAMAVLNELGPGLDEKLYENALIIELTNRGQRVDQQKQYPVYYQNRFIGKLIPDLVVNGLVIVEVKVVESFADVHSAQVLGYLKITDLQLGILLNFKYASLDWKRIVRSCNADKKRQQIGSELRATETL